MTTLTKERDKLITEFEQKPRYSPCPPVRLRRWGYPRRGHPPVAALGTSLCSVCRLRWPRSRTFRGPLDTPGQRLTAPRGISDERQGWPCVRLPRTNLCSWDPSSCNPSDGFDDFGELCTQFWWRCWKNKLYFLYFIFSFHLIFFLNSYMSYMRECLPLPKFPHCIHFRANFLGAGIEDVVVVPHVRHRVDCQYWAYLQMEG